jgi:hypothetical protein
VAKLNIQEDRMTAYELIQRLAKVPADTEVKMATDWSEPIIDDGYLEADPPTLALVCSDHGSHPDEVKRLREREASAVPA